MGPVVPIFEISQELNFLIAFVIGLGFGFALEQAGFSSSRKLAGMFYGYDTTVLKVFFTAAITAMIAVSRMGRQTSKVRGTPPKGTEGRHHRCSSD